MKAGSVTSGPTRVDRVICLDGRFTPSPVASDTSIEAALKSVKLLECIGKGCGEVGSRLGVQRFGLD
jgi:hypothetical protein